MRGVFSGFMSGTALSAILLSAISLGSEAPGSGAPKAEVVEAPAGSGFDIFKTEEPATLPQTDDTQEAANVAQVEAPSPETSVDPIDQALDTTPQAGDAGVSVDPITAPQVETDVSGLGGTAGDQEVQIATQAQAPSAPAGEEGLSVATAPAAPPQPETSELERAEADAATTETAVTESNVVEPDQAQTDTQDEPDVAEAEPQPEAEEQNTEVAQLQPSSEPETLSGVVGNIADGIVTGRLPSVGAEPEEVPETVSLETETSIEIDDGRPPIERFALEFENPDAKPLLSIVLIDEANANVSPDVLADFPYPVSVAVNAANSGAADRAAAYRNAGTEVLAMADLPQNAQPTDAEVTMGIYLEAVPGAVAVMEGIDTGLQQNRKAGEQLAPILLDSGHGLVLFGSGLNTLQKIIAREGVPSGVVFRDFDGANETESMMRRALDQAVFKAGQQEEGVIVVGRMRKETINALIVWGLEDRAERVALAPISAVLNPPAPVEQ